MATRLRYSDIADLPLYGVLLNGPGQYYNGAAYEAYDDASWADYVIDLPDPNGVGLYDGGDLPAGAAGATSLEIYWRAGLTESPEDIHYAGKDLLPAGGDPWSAAERTLTMSAAQVAAAVDGSDLVMIQASQFSATLTGLGSLVGRSALYFTGKRSYGDVDASAVVMIEETDGLLVVEGQTAAEAFPLEASPDAFASLLVNNETTGSVTITVDDDATALMRILSGGNYDIKAVFATGSRVITAAKLSVNPVTTRAIA